MKNGFTDSHCFLVCIQNILQHEALKAYQTGLRAVTVSYCAHNLHLIDSLRSQSVNVFEHSEWNYFVWFRNMTAFWQQYRDNARLGQEKKRYLSQCCTQFDQRKFKFHLRKKQRKKTRPTEMLSTMQSGRVNVHRNFYVNGTSLMSHMIKITTAFEREKLWQ